MERDTVQALEWAFGAMKTRSGPYTLYGNYYRGRHNQVFEIASEAHERYFRDLLERVRENLCKPVVRCFAERLALEGWEGGDADAAREEWTARNMSAMANRVHTDALKLGDGYLLVWPDNEPRVWRQRAGEFVTMPDPGDPETIGCAVKVWKQGGLVRVNAYFADRLERWAVEVRGTDGLPSVASLRPYEDGDGEAVIRHQFGRVPVVRFAHDLDNPDDRGVSILEDVVPLQDVLTKTLADMLIASEFYAMPMRVFTGVQAERNPRTGKTQAEEFDPRRDRNLFFGGTDTKPWTLPAGDIKQVVEVTDSIAVKIARVSGVPMHYLVLGQGNFPSGEALRTAEARLVSRVTDLQDEWGPVWSDLMALLGHPEADPVWVDAAHITETERLERLALQRDLGVPWEQTMKELGYQGPEQVAELYRMREDEKAAAGAAFNAAFNGE